MIQTTPEAVTATQTEAETAAAEAARAVTEAAQAAQAVTALERAVATGDQTVTAEALTEADGRSRFARLRAKAAQAKADKHAEAAHAAKVDVLREHVKEYLEKHNGGGYATTTAAGTKLAEAVTKAYAEFRATLDAAAADFEKIRKEATALGADVVEPQDIARGAVGPRGPWFSGSALFMDGLSGPRADGPDLFRVGTEADKAMRAAREVYDAKREADERAKHEAPRAAERARRDAEKATEAVR